MVAVLETDNPGDSRSAGGAVVNPAAARGSVPTNNSKSLDRLREAGAVTLLPPPQQYRDGKK